jgi:hypothetical protein
LLGYLLRPENGSQNVLNISFPRKRREDAIPEGFGSLVNAEPGGVESVIDANMIFAISNTGAFPLHS